MIRYSVGPSERNYSSAATLLAVVCTVVKINATWVPSQASTPDVLKAPCLPSLELTLAGAYFVRYDKNVAQRYSRRAGVYLVHRVVPLSCGVLPCHVVACRGAFRP